MSLDFDFLGDWASWLGFGPTSMRDYSSEDLRKKWQAPRTYNGTAGAEQYRKATRAASDGFGPSVAAERQRQALSSAGQVGSASLAARQSQMGGQAALLGALGAQNSAVSSAIQQFSQQRGAEQARAQGDYLGYMQSATQEQISQDRTNAAYTQLNLEAKLAEQEARRKRRGGLFGGLGGLVASIFT